eukprot:scpid93755/ scgid9292/ 
MAYVCWGNFWTWHSLFGQMPGYGPLVSINTASLQAASNSDPATTTHSSSAAIPRTSSSSPPSSRTPGSTTASASTVTRPTLRADDADDDSLDALILAGHSSSPLCPATPSTAVTVSADSTLVTNTGRTHARWSKRPLSHVTASALEHADGDDDREDNNDSAALDPLQIVGQAKKKCRKKRHTEGDQPSPVADNLIAGIGSIHRE